MNCDEAFDALTDPEQASNPALEWHLEFCSRCREMQNVLAPALGLLAEGSQSREKDSDPGIGSQTSNRVSQFLEDSCASGTCQPSGQNTTTAPFLSPEAVQVAEQTARSLHSPRRAPASFWLRFAMASALCLTAAFGVSFALAPSEPASPRPQSEPLRLADQCLWTEHEPVPKPAPAKPDSARWVVLSCVACHLEHSLD